MASRMDAWLVSSFIGVSVPSGITKLLGGE
jgi:hypothetical protein